MFARIITSPGLRVASAGIPRALPRAVPRMSVQTMALRQYSTPTKSSTKNSNAVVRFFKNLPAEVVPLVSMVSFAALFGIFMMGKHMLVDDLRRAPSERYSPFVPAEEQ